MDFAGTARIYVEGQIMKTPALIAITMLLCFAFGYATSGFIIYGGMVNGVVKITEIADFKKEKTNGH